jgi:hypothetical protein
VKAGLQNGLELLKTHVKTAKLTGLFSDSAALLLRKGQGMEKPNLY